MKQAIASIFLMFAAIIFMSWLTGCAGYNSFVNTILHPQTAGEWDAETGGSGGGWGVNEDDLHGGDIK